jgi:hypothetical protein
LIEALHDVIERNRGKGKTWAKAINFVELPQPEAWEEPETLEDALRDVTEAVLPTDKLRVLLASIAKPARKGA